jgi:hypothetical protein
MINTLQIVELDESLHTSYNAQGKTRKGSKPIPWVEVRRVGQYKDRGGAWRGSKATAAALLAANGDIVAAGWPGLRVTEVIRDQQVIVRERTKYENWIAAGRPEYGTAGYRPSTMRIAYIKRQNESNHQWGGAVDLDVFAWAEDGKVKGLSPNESLANLWGFLRPHGLTPIIAEPNLHQSEAWHFDHYGPLVIVRELFRDHGYGDVAAQAAIVACILAGTYVGDNKLERYVQARLIISGHWCGPLDGILGRKTRTALAEVGIPIDGALPGLGELVAMLDAKGVGLEEIADA